LYSATPPVESPTTTRAASTTTAGNAISEAIKKLNDDLSKQWSKELAVIGLSYLATILLLALLGASSWWYLLDTIVFCGILFVHGFLRLVPYIIGFCIAVAFLMVISGVISLFTALLGRSSSTASARKR